ncbi:MAG: UDP-N-acetylmuramate--L-alanine ligase, partial [Fidelibacterota bacterium]
LVVGGVVKSLNINAVLGSGDVIVVEADEFDRSFLQLSPTYSVITNIDTDHMECYENQDDLLNAFIQFANAVPFYGAVVACADEPFVQQILPDISRPVITYGLTEATDYSASNATYHETQSDFTVKENDSTLGDIRLKVPGAHNVKNALATVALALEMNIEFDTIREALGTFTGVKRRFEIKGVFDDVMVVDDYAHHPTEVSATLRSIKNGWDRRLVTVLQPHLFTRTREFYEDFARSLLISDVVVVTDVYSAREDPIDGVSGKLIVNAAKSMGHEQTYWVPVKDNIVRKLTELVKPGDLVITLGAGDIWRVCDEYVRVLQRENVAA